MSKNISRRDFIKTSAAAAAPSLASPAAIRSQEKGD
jgi:anaerobic selenocysteine-containing dehydrogenase